VAVSGADEATRRHIADSREEIKIILDPRVPRPSPDPHAAPAVGGRGRGGLRTLFGPLQDPTDPTGGGRGAGGGRQGQGGAQTAAAPADRGSGAAHARTRG